TGRSHKRRRRHCDAGQLQPHRHDRRRRPQPPAQPTGKTGSLRRHYQRHIAALRPDWSGLHLHWRVNQRLQSHRPVDAVGVSSATSRYRYSNVWRASAAEALAAVVSGACLASPPLYKRKLSDILEQPEHPPPYRLHGNYFYYPESYLALAG